MRNPRGVACPTVKATSYSSLRLSWSPIRLAVHFSWGMRESYHLRSCYWRRPLVDRSRSEWGRLRSEGRGQLLRNQQKEVEGAKAGTLGTAEPARPLQPRSGPRPGRCGWHYVPVPVRLEGVRGRSRQDLPRARREFLRLRRRREHDRRDPC